MIDLKNFSFFSTLPTREVEKIKKACRFNKFTSGTTILKEGETLEEFLLVVEGQVSVIKSHAGKKKTLFTLDPGDTYGEVEILNGTNALCTLVGYQDFQVMFIPRDFILRLIGLYPGFARETRELYSRRAPILLEHGLTKAVFGQIVTFFNVKGGAGKSVMSANTAVMLARQWRKRVVLVDLNLAFGDQAILLSLPCDRNIYELSLCRPPLKIAKIEEQLTPHSSGLKVLLPPPSPELANKIKTEFVEQVLEILRANYDFVIVDTHNQLTDLEMMILEMSDLIFLMMTMELTFVKNTKVLLDLLQRLKIPREKVKVVLNRAFKAMGLEPSRVESSLRYAISHFIPSEGDIVIPSINAGVPFVMQRLEGSPLFMAVDKLCQRLVGEEPEKGTWNMFSLIREVFGL
ncbi:MAG: Type II/IV secretion system ATPase TadZ/CpaE, associated with Flp pilus assembly [Candidatus Ozemobacter sibiricus]|jgi:pilus assembly protein CpaE|uniref:Type II/IV secretion system ATPase TadZ/CpaE, associated with Flp pilus assembly n=1 Tax=Candidatus Ozemobacter sibiricus TaxID=2268124 RepID=A0A367ZUD9_9BACT|nr:MAG: Type II/IV secretion system ATPase TadZ/CpaE, associated with Flp pilus assembly [Candidatus Ozemobacter sibiricus]